MKRYLLVVLLACCVISVSAQRTTQDVLYLKNGSVIKGSILPSAEGTTKIQTKDGSVFVYKIEEVEANKVEEITHINGKKVLNYPKHSLGIRGGLLYSAINTGELFGDDIIKQNGVGFHIGGIYEVAMNKRHRWFFQTGIDFQYTRILSSGEFSGRFDPNTDGHTCYDVAGNMLALNVPMMFSCKFQLKDKVGLYPSFGFSHAIGLAGTISGYSDYVRYNPYYDKWEADKGEWTHSVFETYIEDKPKYEPDYFPYENYRFNLRLELNAHVRNVVMGFNVELPVLGTGGRSIIFKEGVVNLGVTVGYNF